MNEQAKRRVGRRWAIPFSLCLAAGLAIYVAFPDICLPRGTSTISLRYAADTFHPCSRDAPQVDADSYWLPTRHEVEDADAWLWVMLQDRDAKHLLLPAFIPFQRQYIGFKRAGVRLIYVNAFQDIYHAEMTDWFNRAVLRKPVLACDGGRYFWGVIYNPETREFEDLQFNGAI